MNLSSRIAYLPRLRAPLIVAGVLLLGACASTPPAPTSSLDAAKVAISNAERADAGHFAAGELTEARTRLASADTAVAQKHMVEADRLAQEARVEAELASARTDAMKAKAVNTDMQHSNSTLTEEIRRGEGAK